MLVYTARMTALSLREVIKPKADPLGVLVREGRAWPWLCDYQMHMNNARYLDLMDDGRTQFFIRTGMLSPFLKRELGGVAAATQIVYRRSIGWMAPFRLETQLVGWDARWYVHRHVFRMEDGQVAAHAYVRSMLRGSSGPISMGAVLAQCGYGDLENPAFSEEVEAFMASSGQVARTI